MLRNVWRKLSFVKAAGVSSKNTHTHTYLPNDNKYLHVIAVGALSWTAGHFPEIHKQVLSFGGAVNARRDADHHRHLLAMP